MCKKFIAVLLFFVALTFTSIGHAEIQIYEGVGEYAMMNDETMDFAKHQAQLEAERNIAEQVYVYVQSQTETENQTLKHDEIIVISETIMKITEVKHQILPATDETFIVRATVKAKIDTDEIDKLMEETANERKQ